MSPSLHHLLASAASIGRVGFCFFVLYKTWPRRRHWKQGFKTLTPQGIPVERMPDYFDFRSRLVVCAFMSVGLCFVLGDLFRRTLLPPAPPPAVAAEPAPAPPPPKIARSSAARDGDVVQIVCGSGRLCAVAVTAPDAEKLNRGQPPSGKVFHIKNGTKATVTGYDPQDTGSDTAEVFLLAGADQDSVILPARSDPDTHGFVPGRWMHELRTKEAVTVYQAQSRGTP